MKDARFIYIIVKLVWVATFVIAFDVMLIIDEVTVDGCCLLMQVTIQNPKNLANLMAFGYALRLVFARFAFSSFFIFYFLFYYYFFFWGFHAFQGMRLLFMYCFMNGSRKG